jgi:5-methylcytosine-specific restriction endonuclease McrA
VGCRSNSVDRFDLYRYSTGMRKTIKRTRRTAVRRTVPTQRMIDRFYASWSWKRLRYTVLLERGARCECCGASGKTARICVDHIKPIRKYWKLRLTKSNLQILCEDCNMGKGSHDTTDWRSR